MTTSLHGLTVRSIGILREKSMRTYKFDMLSLPICNIDQKGRIREINEPNPKGYPLD